MNWLLLRGLARHSEHWGDFPARLANVVAGAGDNVYVLDLPGTGAHCDEVSPDTIPAIREGVQAFARDLPGPLILVGLSLGGMVALDWASCQPQGVAGVIAGVVAINSSSGWSPLWHRLQPNRWGAVLKLMTDPSVDRRESAILSLTSNVKHSPQVLAHWRDLHNRCPVTRRTALRQIRAAARYRPAANPPDMPVLLLASRADRLVSSRCSEKLAELWRCDLAEHSWAGHDLPLDDPEWVLARLQEFRRPSVQS